MDSSPAATTPPPHPHGCRPPPCSSIERWLLLLRVEKKMVGYLVADNVGHAPTPVSLRDDVKHSPSLGQDKNGIPRRPFHVISCSFEFGAAFFDGMTLNDLPFVVEVKFAPNLKSSIERRKVSGPLYLTLFPYPYHVGTMRNYLDMKKRSHAAMLVVYLSKCAHHITNRSPFSSKWAVGKTSRPSQASYFHSPSKMSDYFPLGTMLWVLCVLQSMFYITSGCVVEERTALMGIRSSLVEANSQVPASWGGGDDCCSWEGVICNGNSTRVSDLNLFSIYASQANSTTEGGYSWNLNLVLFSSFHELQLLDLSSNHACIQNFSGLQGLTRLRYLNLSDNSLIGNNVFNSLRKLASLEVINLSGNNMSVTLENTAFRNLMNLREVHLGGNQLRGSIPASLFELPRLEHLDLSGNLLQGHIPMSSSSNISSSLQTLKLSANNLNGTFDFFWLRNCTMLKKIDLSGNTDLAIDVKFHGRVPPFQLKALMLARCKLDRSIIAGANFLGTQRHLQILDLSNTNLTGSMPDWIFANEPTLVYLDLSNNSLVGAINPMWQHRSNLQMINISTNHFIGQLPTNISLVFPNLKVLDASHNIMSGDLPPSLCNISSMAFVDLSNNQFTGEVPTCLFTDIPMLEILKLSNNNLGGSIFGGASNLSVGAIYLDSNNFEGTLPSNLSGRLAVMDLHDNKLSGKLNASCWNLPSLQVLSVASNRLTGEIYPSTCKLTDLQFLDLSDNNFEGSIPSCSGESKLNLLNMSRNSISGFPSGFFNCSYIAALDLRYNQFTGNLDWTQCLSQIKLLLLGWNRFEGQISPNLCGLQYLNIIDFSHNKLSGSLPPCIGSMPFGYYEDDLDYWSMVSDLIFGVGYSDLDVDDPSFIYNGQYDLQGFPFSTKGNSYTYGRNFFNLMFGIDLSANMVSGEIPWEIGNLTRIKSLNLSHNFFTGRIPANFANMHAIESLDLSHNELSGSIPPQLSQLWSLEVFSVAYNNLSGCIPDSGQFSSFGTESYKGNINLHNISKGNRCSPGSGPVEEVMAEASDDPILYMISAASFVLAFWATVSFVFCHSFGRHVILRL
ncbi:hypothetical protein ACP70R_010438 [Stipagrostis hirtigluma subsp. patula]